MSTTTAPTEEQKLTDLHSKMNGKSKVEQAEILRSYMKDNDIKVEDQPKVTLSDDQVRMIVAGSTENAKMAVELAAKEVEERYKLGSSAAKSIATDEVSKTLNRAMNAHRDFQEAAKVIRAITRSATGRARPGELHEAYEAEASYLKETGREARAMSNTTDTTGGYLGGEIFSTLLYDNVSRYSNARKYATVINMDREILRLPKLTGTFTATQDSEAGTISTSQPTFSQFVLNTKKITVLTKPFSVELLETADPALVPTLLEFATRELAKKEDDLIFSTSAPGLLSQSTNNVYLGGDGTSSTSGSTTIADTTFDDMINLIYKLDPQYIPDEDIQGSGLFTSGAARFWVPQALIQVLAKLKGNDQYFWANVQELKHDKMIHGFDVKRCPSMSSSPAVGTRFAAFGDLGRMVCGVRPGFRMEIMSQGSVDSVNLNETNSYAFRVTEFFDADSIDDSGFSLLATAAS